MAGTMSGRRRGRRREDFSPSGQSRTNLSVRSTSGGVSCGWLCLWSVLGLCLALATASLSLSLSLSRRTPEAVVDWKLRYEELLAQRKRGNVADHTEPVDQNIDGNSPLLLQQSKMQEPAYQQEVNRPSTANSHQNDNQIRKNSILSDDEEEKEQEQDADATSNNLLLTEQRNMLLLAQKITDKDISAAQSDFDQGGADSRNGHDQSDPLQPPILLDVLPSSSIWCKGTGSHVSARICKIRNLCFNPRYDRWFIVRSNTSILEGVPFEHELHGIADAGSIDNHPFHRFHIREVLQSHYLFRNILVRHETVQTFITRRLHPHNIMHNIHDDLIPLFHLLREHVGHEERSVDFPFDLNNHRVLLADSFDDTSSTRPLQYLSNLPLWFMSRLTADIDVTTCFRDAVVGTSKFTTWYQYGFKIPQGPIPNKTVNGMHIRAVAEWIIRRNGLPLGEDEGRNAQRWGFHDEELEGEEGEMEKTDVKGGGSASAIRDGESGNSVPLGEIDEPDNNVYDAYFTHIVDDDDRYYNDDEEDEHDGEPYNAFMQTRPPPPPLKTTDQLRQYGEHQSISLGYDPNVDFPSTDLIIILTRHNDRLILNLDALTASLALHFAPLTVMSVSNEEHNFEQQIALLRRARVVIGMHGSILIMSMFCRRGTVILELFPYGVPGENYTPYKTLCELEGMNLVYRRWENTHEDMSVVHENADPLRGGITHLPLAQQDLIRNTRTVPPHLCCIDPHWLYRIYQDTIVSIPEVIQIISDALADSRNLLRSLRRVNFEDFNSGAVVPIIVTEDMICIDDGVRRPGVFWVWWYAPWNYEHVEKYLIRLWENEEKINDTRASAVHEIVGRNEFYMDGFKSGSRVSFQIKIIGSDGRPGNWGPRTFCAVL